MIFELGLLLLILSFLFYFLMKARDKNIEIYDKVFYGLLSSVLMIFTALETFTLPLTTLDSFEMEAIAYLLYGLSFLPFVESMIAAVQTIGVAWQRKGV